LPLKSGFLHKPQSYLCLRLTKPAMAQMQSRENWKFVGGFTLHLACYPGSPAAHTHLIQVKRPNLLNSRANYG
jgi:hypothetical protein